MKSSSSSSALRADPSWRFGIVASSFYKEEMERLVDGAVKTLTAAGVPQEQIQIHWAAGSFEVPLVGLAVAEQKKVDALIGLGIIIEGETHHARLLADQAARGIMNVQLRCGLPFAFEILYVDTLAQAQERATGDYHKGKEAAVAALQTLTELKRIRGEGH